MEETPGDASDDDFKSRLQEWTQKNRECLPIYRPLGESGPDHAKIFEVEVLIKGQSWATGQGRRLKIAENEAARAAWEKIKNQKTG